MTILLVTPFAPYRDGIATYAAQELHHHRRIGHLVEVLSPLPSAAHHHLPLGSAPGWARLVKDYGHYERVIIQLAPDILFGNVRASAERIGVWSALAALGRRTRLELRIHEIETEPLVGVERRAAALALRWAYRVTVHTKAERTDLLNVLGEAANGVEVIDHGRYFEPRVIDDRAGARRALGLDTDGHLFVGIGFLQRHKGFDRAIEAFDLARRHHAMDGAHLHIVGSARIDHPEIASYLAELRALCGANPGVTLTERFVSDDDFDLWLVAADAVVLPYRRIWSSGVMERARLFGRPVIASDLPQLRDQAPVGTVLCADTVEMGEAMAANWSASPYRRATATERVASPASLVPTQMPSQSPKPATADAVAPWDVSAVDKRAIEAQIARRARRHDLTLAGIDLDRTVAEPSDGDDIRRAVDSLLALGSYERPQPISARPGVAPAKKAIKRATDWQVEPVAVRVEAVLAATVEAVTALEAEIERRERRAAADRAVTVDEGPERPPLPPAEWARPTLAVAPRRRRDDAENGQADHNLGAQAPEPADIDVGPTGGGLADDQRRADDESVIQTVSIGPSERKRS